jgi:hypothetical protein
MSASIGTTQGEIVVAKFLARNGPRGTYSHFCKSEKLSLEMSQRKGKQREREVHLNIPGTPVVHDDHSKDMFLCGLGWYWLSLHVAWTHKERLTQTKANQSQLKHRPMH